MYWVSQSVLHTYSYKWRININMQLSFICLVCFKCIKVLMLSVVLQMALVCKSYSSQNVKTTFRQNVQMGTRYMFSLIYEPRLSESVGKKRNPGFLVIYLLGAFYGCCTSEHSEQIVSSTVQSISLRFH